LLPTPNKSKSETLRQLLVSAIIKSIREILGSESTMNAILHFSSGFQGKYSFDAQIKHLGSFRRITKRQKGKSLSNFVTQGRHSEENSVILRARLGRWIIPT